MYGADAYGSIPYGASGFEVEDLVDHDAMLAEPRSQLVVTAQIKVWEIGGSGPEETLCVASATFATPPDGVPASLPFRGVLDSYNFKRSINTGDRFGGMATGEGTLVFANADGFYDDFVDLYAVDGREVIVRIGPIDDPLEDHLILFNGVAVDLAASQDAVTLTIRDKSDRLNGPAQPNLYAGTGDEEGGADLTGKRKPLLLGLMEIVPAVLINEAALIYQVHDGTFEDYSLNSVWDRGANIPTDIAGTDFASYAALAAGPLLGGYNTCAAEGLFRLNASPAGWVAITARSTNMNGNTSAGLVRGVVAHATDLTEADLDQGSFDVVDLAQTEEVGYFIAPEDSKTAADAINMIVAGIGGWAGFDRLGKLAIGIFAAPTGDPVAYFDRDDGSAADLRRESMPSGIWPPPWRWRVAYRPHGLVTNDLVGSAADAIAFFAMPYRTRTAEDTAVRDDHPQARDPAPIEAGFSIESGGAQPEADRLLALYSSGYRLFGFATDRRALTLKIGDEINVTFPRFGLDAGRNMVIVSIEDRMDFSEGGSGIAVEITAFG